MRTLGPVTVDLAAGIVTLGGNSITLAREGDHFIAPGGLHARALRFEERSLVVAGALLEPEPNRALLVKLRNLAGFSGYGYELADAIVLALAGGGEPAPNFAECARAACRKGGLDWQSVQESPAILVDQLACAGEFPKDDNDGWTCFEFWESAEESLEACCRQMLKHLLQRGAPQEEEQDSEVSPVPDTWQPTDLSPRRGGWPTKKSTADIDCLPIPKASSLPRPQRLRARVKLIRSDEEFKAGMPVASEASDALGGSVRAIAQCPEGNLEHPDEAKLSQYPEEPPADLASLTQRPANPWADSGDTKKRSSPTLRDALALVNMPGAASRSSLQSLVPQSDPKTVARPAVAPLRANRLRNLPEWPEALQVGQRQPSREKAASNPVTHVAPSQRDWLYDIATALADECDLRGLDA